VALTLSLLISPCLQAQENARRNDKLQQEEATKYFERWLNQEVVYIISREEKEAFLKLTTDDEREQFIEQFWFRRDPDPKTAINEFKEEHYRRIAYANERYESGEPGWKTDRGRIYILHGPPAAIEPHPTGGPYDRPLWEGGGTTVSFPFEVWRYGHIDGIGDDIEIEFVDPSYSGEYRIARDPDDKDAFAKVPTLGATLDEMDGVSRRIDRGTHQDYRFSLRKDQPFERYYRYFAVQRPPSVKYKELQQAVQVNVSFDQLPARLRVDQFKLGEGRTITPVTIELDNKDLSFVDQNGRMTANVAVYGAVTDLRGQIVNEFEDDLVNALPPGEADRRSFSHSVYQKHLVLDTKMRYKVDLVIKDSNSGKMTVFRQAILPQKFDATKLSASTMLLADSVRQLDDIPKDDQMFVLGDILVRPSLSKQFVAGAPLAVYFQLYNVALDQSTSKPSLSLKWTLSRDGQPVAVLDETDGQSVPYFSESRLVVLRGFPTADLKPGRYRMKVDVKDLIDSEELTLVDEFEVVGGPSSGS